MTTTETKAVTITLHLPVKLDSYRKQALHDIAHAEFLEQERLAVHLKNVTDSVKGMIKVSYKKQADANHDLKNGFEMKEVSCEQRIENDHMVTYRLDTQEKVDERALTVEELREVRKKTGK